MRPDTRQGDLFSPRDRVWRAVQLADQFDRDEITANALSVGLAELGFSGIKFNPVRAHFDGVEYPLGN